MRESDIDLTSLREQLTYDPLTGDFTWARAKGRQPCGAKAGVTLATGYVAIRFNALRYLAHRLAWLYAHGTSAGEEIDHIDGNRSNNRLSNLRSVSRAENQQNQRKAQKSNGTGMLGVSRSDSKGGYRARIFANGKEICLGSFASKDEAHAAYVKAKREIHTGGTL